MARVDAEDPSGQEIQEDYAPNAVATRKAPNPRTRRRVPREVRIPQIARIAEDLFGQFGYHGTSMDDVARLAGVSKPVVYDLVGSKEELFKLCMARSANELASRVAAAVGAAPADDRLRAGALAFFRFVDEHRPAWRGLLASGSAPLTAEMAEIRRNQAGLVAGLLIQGESSGRSFHSSGPASATDRADQATERTTDQPTDRVIADALANAINGAFEALAGWWQSHESMSAYELADLIVQLMGPGLEAMAGVAAGEEGAG
jgi:AcrR family transcriptional regulator